MVNDDNVSRTKSNLQLSIALTAVVGSPGDMWEKLCWNLDRYNDELQSSRDGKSVGFAALDYAKTAVALQEWVNVLITQRNRRERTVVSKLDDDDIQWQGAIRAIANATKHGRFSDKDWPGGTTTLGIVAPEELRGRVHLKMTLSPVLMEDGARWEFILSDPAHYEPVQAGDAFLANFIDWDRNLMALGLL